MSFDKYKWATPGASSDSPFERLCKHSNPPAACDKCFVEEENARLKAELAAARAEIAALTHGRPKPVV